MPWGFNRQVLHKPVPIQPTVGFLISWILIQTEKTWNPFILPIIAILILVPVVLHSIPNFRELSATSTLPILWISGSSVSWSVNEYQEGRPHLQGFAIMCGVFSIIALVVLALNIVRREFRNFWIFIPVGCTWLMCYFSAGSGGSGRMRGFFEALFHSPTFADAMVILVRKSIHVTFYSLVAVTMLMAVRTMGESVKRARWTALALALVIGSTDELRQSLVPGRTGQWQDVLLDMSGAFVFTWLLANRLSRKDAGAKQKA